MAAKQANPIISDFCNIPADAIVHEDEQPFPIPDHWEWVRLGALCLINPPKPKFSHLSDTEEVSFIPMPAVSDKTGSITELATRPLSKVAKGYTTFKPNDVLFAKITPCMENGKSAVVPSLRHNLGFGSTEFFVLRPSEVVIPEYIHYYIRQPSFRSSAKHVMTGAVGQQRVPKTFLESCPFPLPPIIEQEEIIRSLKHNLLRVSQARAQIVQSMELLKDAKRGLVMAALSGQQSQMI